MSTVATAGPAQEAETTLKIVGEFEGRLPNLDAALVAAQAAATPVGKDGFNRYHEYKYASAEAIIEACRSTLAKAGVSVTRERYTVEWERLPGNGELIAGMLNSTFRIQHSSGEFRFGETVWPFETEKGRTINKALAGGLTQSLSHFLRDVLLISREDAKDEDPDGGDDRGYTPPPRGGRNDRRGQEPEPTQGKRPEPTSEPTKPKAGERVMPAGYPPVVPGSGLGPKFVEHAERQMALAGLTWPDIQEQIQKSIEDKSRCSAADPVRWEDSLGVGIACFIEARRAKAEANRSKVPTQEAAAAAKSEPATAPANPEGPIFWPGETDKRITTTMPLYWQRSVRDQIASVLKAAKSGVVDGVLLKLEQKYEVPTGDPKAAIKVYERIRDEIKDGQLDVTAFVAAE